MSRKFYVAVCNYLNEGVKLPVRVGHWPHWTVPVRTTQVPPRMASAKWLFEESLGAGRVEIGTYGQQFVVSGKHPDGMDYRWQHGSLIDISAADLVYVDNVDDTIGLLNLFDDLARKTRGHIIAKARGTDRSTLIHSSALDTEPPLDGVTIEDAVTDVEMLTGYDEYETWIQTGMALHHQFNGDEKAYNLWDQWSRKSLKYKGRADTANRWRSFDSSHAAPVTYASILHEVQPQAMTVPGFTRTSDASLSDALLPLMSPTYRYDAERDAWKRYLDGRWINIPHTDVFAVSTRPLYFKDLRDH